MGLRPAREMISPGLHLYLWLIPTGLIIGHVAIAVRIFKGSPRLENVVRKLALVWSGLVLVAWVLRVVATGHLPVLGMYESSLSLALATVVVAAVWEMRHSGDTVITPLACLVAAALLSHGESFDSTPYVLSVSERSWIVAGHAVVGWLAFGMLALSNFLALRIVLARTEGDDLETPMVRALQIGFGLSTLLIASGSFYRLMLAESPKTLDLVEILILIVWLAIAALLLLQRFAGWKGKRLAAFTLAAFVLLLFSYLGPAHLPMGNSYHNSDAHQPLEADSDAIDSSR